MSIVSIFREAGQALRFNRQRSILTTVSLAWGVACFVILYSYGDGFHIALQTAFRSIGQDLVLMIGGRTSSQAGGERAGRRVRLETSDVEEIRTSVPLVAAISPEMMMGGMTVTHEYRTQTTMIRAVRAAYGRVRNQTMATGRWIEPEDDAQKRRVAILGAKMAEKLFGEIPPEGEEIESTPCDSRWWAFSETKRKLPTTTRRTTKAYSFPSGLHRSTAT
jgi:putative ABC transport system permease protein